MSRQTQDVIKPSEVVQSGYLSDGNFWHPNHNDTTSNYLSDITASFEQCIGNVRGRIHMHVLQVEEPDLASE